MDNIYSKEYILSRISEADILEHVSFGVGNDGLPYAIWEVSHWPYSWEYMEVFGGDGIACCGGYENAVCLQDTIGM